LLLIAAKVVEPHQGWSACEWELTGDGLHVRDWSGDEKPANAWDEVVPYSLIVTVACGWLFVAWMIGRRKRQQPGLCPSCGYDLRGSPDRCPECGSVYRSVSLRS
jgi:hypothetical protein